MISRSSRSTPPASMSRSERAISDSGIPNSRRIRCSYAPARARTVRSAGVSSAAAHIGWSSRGGPGSTSTAGRSAPSGGGTTRPGAVPTGSRTVAPRGTSACLRLPARIAASSRLRQRPRRRSRIARIRPSSASSSTSGRPANSATTSAVRSSAVGPRPPLVTIRSTPWPARKSSAARRSAGAVGDDHRVRELQAALAQALGQPGAVAVGDDPREHLGPGDHDAGASGHVQVGRRPTGSSRGLRPVRRS